jgi:trimeric autotransporter adhesin
MLQRFTQNSHPGKVLSLIPILLFICSGVLPVAEAVSPAPDGCYPNFTTAEGCEALGFLTTGAGNTALGWRSLFLDSTGGFNTGLGGGALALNNGDSNTAVGTAALLLNTTGTENVAIGTDALVYNDSGSDNSAVGAFALLNNTADGNTAAGAFALQANTTGGTLGTTNGELVGPNTAVGSHALESNTIASGNTAVGYQALGSMVAGADFGNGPTDLSISTAVGFQALANVNGSNNAANDAFGYRALFDLTNGYNNVAVGTGAGRGLTTGFLNVYIGHPAGAANENGHTYIGNINNTPVSGGGTDTVTVDLSTGLLGHLSSSRRYKKEIKAMDNASETLYRLKPVTYRYKKEIDQSQSLDYGLVAEDVAEIDPNLTVCNKEGQIESVRYNAINAMLLNEFLKEHKRVEEQAREIQEEKRTISELKRGMNTVIAQLKEQASQIQKVSAQLAAASPSGGGLELCKGAPQTVAGKK